MEKKKKTAKPKKAEATENGSYGGSPIYLTLNGNNWQVNGFYFNQALIDSLENNRPLYVNANAGAPNLPPPCVPGMPNYPNCGG